MDLDQLDQALTGQDITAADVVAALAVLAIGTLLAFLLGRAARAYLGRPDRQSAQIAKLAARVVRWLIQIVAIAWALNILGFGVEWLTITVAIVIVGLVFAARPLVENLAAGAALVARPAFGVGDEIEIDEIRGEVLEFTGRSTVLRLRDGRRVHIPNTRVVQETVVVLATQHARRTSVDVTITLDTDVDEAERAILEALAGLEAVVADPAPSVRARELTEGVRLSVRFWHGSAISDGNRALDQAVRAIKRQLERAGIELAVPQLDLRRSSDDAGSPVEPDADR